MQDEAEALGATGIVDVTVSEHSHAWRQNYVNIGNQALVSGEMLELFVIGTAVVPMPDNERAEPPKTKLIHAITNTMNEATIGVEE